MIHFKDYAFKKYSFAREFAVRAHEGLLYGTLEYHVHLDDVVQILMEHRFVDCVVPGYLHDCVEDTPITFGCLYALFGTEDTRAVRFCTDSKGCTRTERKARTLERQRADLAVGTPPWAIKGVRVKVADRLANVRRSIGDSARTEMYCGEHAAFREALYIAGVCDALWSELDACIQGESDA